MAIDPNYIPAFSIEDVLLDKDTGAPLSGGLVYFEQDDQRGVLKPIYQITGTSPNYSYTQLPNPMTLSSIGTFEDSLGNPVVPYFYPYDSEGDVEYYYVRVTSSEDVPQFTREAVPYVGLQDNAEVLSVITNELSNPQFIDLTFPGSHVYSFSAASQQVVNIAPDWDIIVTCPTTGTVTITQTAPAGSLNIPTNPGTILTISSAGITALQLRQRILGSPNLWGSGFLSGTFVAKTYSGTAVTLNMLYSQSNGTVVDQLIVSASLPASGDYEMFSNAFLIPASNSTQTFPNAYIDIYFDIPLSIQIDITSVMVAFTGNTAINNIAYDQESYARQVDHLYHYAAPIVPIGTVIDFAAATLPLHYLPCNGAAVSRTTYARLFAVIGTTWGVGDGSTTFNLPGLADYVTAGSGGTFGAVGAKVGAASAVLVAANVPQHTHKTTVPVQGVAFGFGYASGTATTSQTFTSDGGESMAGVLLTTPPTAFSIVQPTAIMQKIIRYQ
jgi:microcystin-dependent protein